ncbi:Flp pilus assembly protein CpaB [Rubinisphaera brasiliensis]|uniref:Flp pilus assembly protein CpaB n=1 Tax=Rubinisphaera brasiliensis (strain ATCC 49424 / DSM 5305 / JCM 21570 / IAM 15109 / NBRC 103401 / IFAM 1448) TaxID=756272 RepID=F0SRL2_RUBBR|nr:Flp pilus assembly protein CpaB [Rubinisphaera brasiliensis]ADY59135.1 Flp pilus assembly protein CpaB [Rubinisphaera brasiliensis DSM 5305]
MKMKTILVLAFAVGCGLIAMVGVQQMIAQQSNKDQNQTVEVLVAAQDISPGVLLNQANCAFKKLPVEGVPSDAVRSKEEYAERGLLVPVMAGDIIRKSKLGARGEIAASASIPAGMRTVSIQVNDTKTHSGLLQPGDRVDLQVTYEVRTSEGFRVTKTAILLEYIEVFASDAFRNLEAGESKEIKAKNITLLVTPDQANFIQLANTKGELVPIMRSRADSHLITPEGVDAQVIAELKTGMDHDSIDPLGKEDKQEEKQPEPQKASSSFADFLNNLPKMELPKPQSEDLEPQVDDSWTITIYAGEDIITQDVSLSGNVSGPLPKPAKKAAKQPVKQKQPEANLETSVPENLPELNDELTEALPQEMSQSLKGMLDTLWSGGKKPVQPIQPPPGDGRAGDEEPGTFDPRSIPQGSAETAL